MAHEKGTGGNDENKFFPTWGSFSEYYLFTGFASRTEVYFNQHYCIFPPEVSSENWLYNFYSDLGHKLLMSSNSQKII